MRNAVEKNVWPLAAILALIDLCARLAVPASLWGLARGNGEAAIAAAAAVNVLSVARTALHPGSAPFAPRRAPRRWPNATPARG